MANRHIKTTRLCALCAHSVYSFQSFFFSLLFLLLFLDESVCILHSYRLFKLLHSFRVYQRCSVEFYIYINPLAIISHTHSTFNEERLSKSLSIEGFSLLFYSTCTFCNVHLVSMHTDESNHIRKHHTACAMLYTETTQHWSTFHVLLDLTIRLHRRRGKRIECHNEHHKMIRATLWLLLWCERNSWHPSSSTLWIKLCAQSWPGQLVDRLDVHMRHQNVQRMLANKVHNRLV